MAAIANAGVILPQNGFHAGLRAVTAETGTLLLIDETHTLTSGPGGLIRHWGLLSMAAARVTLESVLTEAVYDHAARLGAVLADGIERCSAAHGFVWRAHRLFNRSGYTHGPELPVDAAGARASFDSELFNLQRLFMANRGVWKAIDSAGPAIGVQTTAEDVARYLGVLDEFLGELS